MKRAWILMAIAASLMVSACTAAEVAAIKAELKDEVKSSPAQSTPAQTAPAQAAPAQSAPAAAKPAVKAAAKPSGAQAQNAQGRDWLEYMTNEWKIKFQVPKEMQLQESEKGNWGMLEGVTSDGVYVVIQAEHTKSTLEEVETYAEKELGINRSNFSKVDGGTTNKLEYRTYLTTGKVRGIDAGLAVMVAQHTSDNVRYLAYIFSPSSTFDQNKGAFEYFYNNVQGQ